MVNSINLLGHVYNIKKTVSQNGNTITFFTLTTYKKMGKDKPDKKQFHNCVAYSTLGDLVNDNVKEADRLMVFGELDYYDKDSVTRSQVIVKEISFIEKKSVA